MFQNFRKSVIWEYFSENATENQLQTVKHIDNIYIKAIKEERQAIAHKKQSINMYGRCEANDTGLNRVCQHFKPHMQDN